MDCTLGRTPSYWRDYSSEGLLRVMGQTRTEKHQPPDCRPRISNAFPSAISAYIHLLFRPSTSPPCQRLAKQVDCQACHSSIKHCGSGKAVANE